MILDFLAGWLFGPACFAITAFGLTAWANHQSGRWCAPLLGISLLSLVGLFEYICGIPAGSLGLALIVISSLGAVFFYRRMWNLWKEPLCLYLGIHTVVYSLMATIAFPGQWLAGGDWYVHLSKAIAIQQGALGPEHLDRPSLYAAGSLPLLVFISPLMAFTAHAAAAGSASLMTLFCPGLISAGERQGAWRHQTQMVILVLISPFFLISLQNHWPKLVMCGCLVAMLSFALGAFRKASVNDLLFAALWFCLGVGYHYGHIVYVPFVVWIAIRGWKFFIRQATLRHWVALLLIPLICVFAFEIWSIARFGLEVKVRANPLVVYDQDMNFFSRVWQNILSSVAGDQAWIRIYQMWTDSDAGPMKLAKAAYFSIAALIPWFSGTVLGWVLLTCPLWSNHPRKWPGSFQDFFKSGMGMAFLGSSIFGLVLLQGVVHWGALQAGMPGLVMLAYWYLGKMDYSDCAYYRALALHLFFGLLPFLFFNLLVATIVELPLEFLESPRAELLASDGDLRTVQTLSLSTFGLSGYPWVHLLSISVLLSGAYLMRKYGSSLNWGEKKGNSKD